MQAAIHGNKTVLRILRILLSKGAAQCSKDHKSEIALQFASLNENYAIVNRILGLS